MSWKLTLVFNVDKIRFTRDILSSCIPVLRISGRSSDKSMKWTYHQHKLKDHCEYVGWHLRTELPLNSKTCPMVALSPDTKKHSTNWTKAMRTSGLPWRIHKEKKLSIYLYCVKIACQYNILNTFLSFLFANPDRDLLMCIQFRTSLAASGPWDTKAVRKLRHWRTNLRIRKQNISLVPVKSRHNE